MGMNRAAKRVRNELERYPSDEVCVHPIGINTYLFTFLFILFSTFVYLNFIDWHMTMDCGKEERDRKRAKKEADEECVERTTVRIIQVNIIRWTNILIIDGLCMVIMYIPWLKCTCVYLAYIFTLNKGA